MKLRIISFIILIVLGFALWGYFRATPGLEDETLTRPIIEIMPDSFDFGQIEYGQVVEYVFKIKNSGNEILEIKKLATSCGCTKAEVNQEQITPQTMVELKVTYDTGMMSGSHARGEQERIIYIKSNDPINPQIEVMIYAYVK